MNAYKIKWDLFIIILSVYNSVFLPLELSIKPPFMNENWKLEFVNHSIDFMFMIDILISFRTTQVNSMTGDEIRNPSKIALNYLKGRFIIDILSTIPFDTIFKFYKGK